MDPLGNLGMLSGPQSGPGTTSIDSASDKFEAEQPDVMELTADSNDGDGPAYPTGVIVRDWPLRIFPCKGCDFTTVDDDSIFCTGNTFGLPPLPHEWGYRASSDN